jgi:hypothetical protein
MALAQNPNLRSADFSGYKNASCNQEDQDLAQRPQRMRR